MRRKKVHLKKDEYYTYCGLKHKVMFDLYNVSNVNLSNLKPIDYNFILNKWHCVKCNTNSLKERQGLGE